MGQTDTNLDWIKYGRHYGTAAEYLDGKLEFGQTLESVDKND